MFRLKCFTLSLVSAIQLSWVRFLPEICSKRVSQGVIYSETHCQYWKVAINTFPHVPVLIECYNNLFLILQLSSQKQIGSWSSKGKLSSPVVYDADGNQYIAVFSRNELRLWTEHEENLDKVKKMKVRNILHYTVLGDLENVCSARLCEVLPVWGKRIAKHLSFID